MSEKLDYQSFCAELLRANPNITPAEMCRNMHTSNYSLNDCTAALRRFFAVETADSVSAILIGEFKHPLPAKSAFRSAMAGAGFPDADVTAALDKNYPTDTSRYAINVSGSATRPYAGNTGAYAFGAGDFTVEAWVKTTHAGTVISTKSGPGGYGNGGYLLVIKPDGTIKFATDDGLGFYEVNTANTLILNGSWHHILGTRKNHELSVYCDFIKMAAVPRTDRWPGLDVSNGLRLLLSGTDQWQEPYNLFEGAIGEVRVWNTSKTYANMAEWEACDYISPGLVGCWPFTGQKADDISLTGNLLALDATVTFSQFAL